MKKSISSILFAITVFAISFISCQQQNPQTKVKEDLVIWESEDDWKLTTKDNWEGIDITNIDLDGYKYLNIEVYSPNAGTNSVTIDAWGENENVATFNSILTSEPLILQSVFGVNNGTYYRDGVEYQCTSNILGRLNYGAHYYNENQEWVLKEGIDIYIKRIWATNEKYENDTTKDRDIFIASEEDGYKITSKTDYVNFSVGTRNLNSYKYLNMELYSPNSGDYDIKIDGWGSERVSVIDTKLAFTSASSTKIVQSPFGVNRGTWEDFINGVWQNEIPSTSNDLNCFAFGVHDGDNWNLKEGIDIYIKRIWVTDTQLDQD